MINDAVMIDIHNAAAIGWHGKDRSSIKSVLRFETGSPPYIPPRGVKSDRECGLTPRGDRFTLRGHRRDHSGVLIFLPFLSDMAP